MCWPGAKCTWDNHALGCKFAKYSPFKNIFTRTLSNKPLLIWLSTTPPYLIYVATLLCNLSFMACFADINVSQGSVATYARCGGMFNIHLTANSLVNLQWKNAVNLLRFDRIVVMSLWPRFLAHPVFRIIFSTRCYVGARVTCFMHVSLHCVSKKKTLCSCP